MKKLSWKTTSSGVATIVTAIGVLITNISQGEIYTEANALAIGVIISGIQGLFARDNKVTSEEAGAK